MLPRRRAVQRGLQLLGGALLLGCANETTGVDGNAPRLTARPGVPTEIGATGVATFANAAVDGMVFVPTTADRQRLLPLVIFLHDAPRDVDIFVNAFAPGAESAGVMVLAPYATEGTWDAITGSFGPDIDRLNAALQWAFDRWRIDPERIVISGFGDGGTYALAVGRANGDLFSRVVAYSPGFWIEVDPVGLPPHLVTHGNSDDVNPFTASTELIVPELRRRGYAVDFFSFDGGHAVSLSRANEVMSALRVASIAAIAR